MQKLVKVMAGNAVFSICDMVCNGECAAIGGFNTSKAEACKSKIAAFLSRYLEVDSMQNGLFEMSTHKYRKRPAEIDAIRFTRSNFDDIKSFTGGKAKGLFIERCPNGKCTCLIETLNGDLVVAEGDFIIRGIKGELYACKPDTFFQSYELVEDS